MGRFSFILAVLFAATVSFADGLCVQLCVDCSLNPENETCSKVDQVCGNCPVILDSLKQDSLAAIARADSIEQEKARKDSLQSIDIRKLADIIQKNCKSDTCTFEVTVDNGQLGHIRAKKGNKTVAKTDPEQTQQESLLPPISEECKNFCSLCSSENQGESSSTCEKVEEQCKCTAYAEQERMLAEKAEADSIAAVDKFLNQMQTVQASANSVFEFCERKTLAKTCSVMVKIESANMSLVDLLDLATKPIVKQDTIVNEAPNDSAIVAVIPAKDTVAKDSSKQTSSSTHKKEPQKIYKGISIAYEDYLEHDVANYRVEPNKQLGVNLGFLIRSYFYQWGSVQTGINIVYHYAEHTFDTDDLYAYNTGYGYGYIDYENIMLEVPFQFRLGFPLGASNLSPFISASVHVRKPVYMWAEYDVRWEYPYYEKQESYDKFYASYDWELLAFIGFGTELNRHFSLQWQFLPISIVTNTDRINNYYCDDTDGLTWRISMDIAW